MEETNTVSEPLAKSFLKFPDVEGRDLDISASDRLDAVVNEHTPPPVPSQPVHSGLATASMICGFLVLPSCFATLLPALILGHIAMSRAGCEGGNTGRAKLGLIFGYGSLVMIPVIAALAGLVAPLVIRQRQKADQVECMSHARKIGMALEGYRSDHGSYPADLKLLETEGITTNIDKLLGVNARNDGEWLYFPKADTTKPRSPLLISPPIHKKCVVLQVDGAVRSVDKAGLPVPAESGEDTAVRIPAPVRGTR